MLAARKLTMRPLREMDLPALDFGMTNVTAEGEGVRFLPHGIHFTEKGATVRLKYDRTRIPSGYTEDDIRTYYFDNDTKHWVALERVKVDKQEACVVSRTTHFTDMINGVIQAPESPETEGFAPTMMNDIKAADPTAKINLIAPPQANNRGTASLQYAFEMPPARNGMAPSLGIQYSSEGGSGWLGEGWSLSVPSISLDTRWGVPRYDMDSETETYLLSGSMLSTMDDKGQMGVAHRGDKMPRKADRQFYTRQGGDFSRIIRKGSSPADYYWEVTDKQGVKYTYGGEGAVLKGTFTDVSGNTREVISEWKLRRVEETHGDFMEYVYETADEDVRGGLKAKALYLKEVRAGNVGQEPHTVVTFEGGKTRQVKTNNARYGYLTSSNRLLERVTVNFRGNVLRSYAFEYRNGAFNRELLAGVRHLDSNGQEVSFQKFSYYDDVQSDKGYVPFKDSQETWNMHNDGLDAGFVNPLQSVTKRFSDKPTALGGSASTSFSGSFYAGVGILDGSPWKGNTAGGSYNYSSDKSKGLSTLADLNGDGLPDKVYRKGGAVYYRPQKSSSGNNEVLYGDAIKVSGISSFSTSKSSTNSGGVKATVGYMSLTVVKGKDFSKTKTKTTEYFSDINGDGLVDLVSNGKVYFNHLEFDSNGNAVPTFTLSSADTPSPIIYSGKIDASVITIDLDEQKEAVKSSPMEDIVRVWQAPRDGMVSISGTVSLIAPEGDYDKEEYDKADGVRVSIQKGNAEKWHKDIAKGDASAYPASVDAFEIKKGERIYFRVQSGAKEQSNGAFDKVAWSPVITYAGTAETLPGGYSTTVYKPAEGAVYDVNTVANVEGVPFSVSGKFSKPVTTDDVVLRIIGSNNKKDDNGNDNPNYTEQVLFTKTYPAAEKADAVEVSASIANAEKFPNIGFEIASSSNVNWEQIRWIPSVTYKDSSSVDQTLAIPAHYRMFTHAVKESHSYTFAATDTAVIVKPRITVAKGFNGDVTLTVKTADKLLAKKTFTITEGALKADVLKLENPGTEKIWFEYHYPGTLSEDALTVARVLLQSDTLGLPKDSVNAGFYVEGVNSGFGMLYRGWGGFVYNASEGRYGKPIDEALLKLPENENAKIDPLTLPFTPIGTDQMSPDHWVGQRQEIYLTAAEAGTARLAEQDVVITNPLDNQVDVTGLAGDCLQGTGAAAVTLVSKSKSKVSQSGALGITFNDASGSAENQVAMMDMNGDGYPDIVAGGSVQYTNTQGGLSGEKYNGIGNTHSENSSKAWGYGGSPVASVSNIVNLSDNIKAIKNAKNNANANPDRRAKKCLFPRL